MKRQTTGAWTTTLMIVLALGAISVPAPAEAIIIINSMPVSVAQGQSLQFNVAHIGNPDAACAVQVRVFGSTGRLFIIDDGDIAGGATLSVIVDRDRLPAGLPPRLLLRAAVEVRDPECMKRLVGSVEVFNNATGETTVGSGDNFIVIVGGAPEPR